MLHTNIPFLNEAENLFVPPALVWTLCKGWIPVSTERCSHCESTQDWNWLKDSRFQFPISVLIVSICLLFGTIAVQTIISYLFLLLISGYSSVSPKLTKWADYMTSSSVNWCSCLPFLLVSSSQLCLVFLPWGIWQCLETILIVTAEDCRTGWGATGI